MELPSFHHKQPVLNQYLRQHTRRPDAILLQETNNAPTTLPGYQTFHTTHPLHRVSTLVRRRIPVIEHDLNSPHIEHLFLELIPNRKRKECIFLLNIYNSPKDKARCRFLTLFKKALHVAGTHPLLIGGDFNLAHTGWGYVRTEAAARNLWQDYHDLGLTLITDPSFPTRLGTSTTRDSTPTSPSSNISTMHTGPIPSKTWAATIISLLSLYPNSLPPLPH